MKTTYLNAEIETLNLLERNGDLSEYGKDKLAEFKAIKQALALCAVVRQSEQLKEKETMTFDEFLQNYFIEIQPRLYKNIKEGYVRDKNELWFYYKNLDISL